MTTIKYLEKLLASQDLSEKQEKDLQSHKEEVTKFLREEFGDDPVIKYAGSREKGTMISDSYDLDIVCYFPSSDDRSLKEIREDLVDRLAEKYVLTHKSSAERILDLKGSEAPADFHIDVVPGRFIKDTKDVFLHVSSGDKERMQTNLKVHIDHIVDSGCAPIIRLVKLWTRRNNISIRTFVLELFVVHALSGYRNKGDLEKGFLKVLESFRDDFASTRLEDPANTNNIVSELVEDSDKSAISQAAESILKVIEESEDIENWKKAFKDESDSSKAITKSVKAATGYMVGGSFTPPSQWSGNDN